MEKWLHFWKGEVAVPVGEKAKKPRWMLWAAVGGGRSRRCSGCHLPGGDSAPHAPPAIRTTSVARSLVHRAHVIKPPLHLCREQAVWPLCGSSTGRHLDVAVAVRVPVGVHRNKKFIRETNWACELQFQEDN